MKNIEIQRKDIAQFFTLHNLHKKINWSVIIQTHRIGATTSIGSPVIYKVNSEFIEHLNKNQIEYEIVDNAF